METVPRQPVDIGHGEIGDFLAKDARGVGGRKAKPPGRRKVDIIDADAPFDDSFQPSRLARFQHARSEEHTSELQSLMRISYAVFCLKKKNKKHTLSSSLTTCHMHTIKHKI